MSLLGAIAAALTLGARRPGVLVSLLVLPLYLPPLIFGTGAVEASAAGGGARAHLLLLGALTLAALPLARWRPPRRCARRSNEPSGCDRSAADAAPGLRYNAFGQRARRSDADPLCQSGALHARERRGAAVARRARRRRARGRARLVAGRRRRPTTSRARAVRIMFIHVPAAWMALSVYLFVAVASAVALVWRHPLAEIAAQAAAPVGAAFTLVCLATGSLWGRPMWGAWWVWDARLTSVLVLFFLYLGYIALVNAFDDPKPRRARRLAAGAGRRRQPADHQVLGRLVEHVAPAGQRRAARRPDDRAVDAAAAAGHGGRASCCCSPGCCCCACARC